MSFAPWAEAFFFGALAAISLPLGAVAGAWLRPSARLTSGVMAFGAGALLAAMSFELVLPALQRDHFGPMAIGLIIGCVCFVGLNHVLNGQGAFLRKAATLAEYARGVKRRKVEEALEELSKVDILRSLPPEEAQALVPYVTYRTVPAGEIVFDQGDPGDALYIIEEGRVAVMRTERGRTTTLAHLGKGETFGEMALLTERTRTASVVTVEPVSLWKIHREDFERLISQSPPLKQAVIQLMETRDARTEALMKAEEWRDRAFQTLDPESLQPTAQDIQEVMRQARQKGAAGFAIWLGSALDGVGESVVIGATTVASAVSVPLLGGVFLANLPESMSSAATLRRQGTPAAVIFWMWTSLVLLAGFCAAAGYVILVGANPERFSFFEGLAAGAILSMIAQTMLPEAFEDGGGPAVAMLTVAGFLAGVLLGIVTG
jgi:CRP-like cAMP-binding protein